ncbi:platelet-activating factor receptor-like [Oncorhynchus keta]|uniref:platelet-activating factor receptor-like n=1 Tax=Oncorhynchus keta TaxID=8018 RepID=UPI0015F8CF90|nr:platelet-activating factor receptor-like [Oncorhynchus keta]
MSHLYSILTEGVPCFSRTNSGVDHGDARGHSSDQDSELIDSRQQNPPGLRLPLHTLPIVLRCCVRPWSDSQQLRAVRAAAPARHQGHGLLLLVFFLVVVCNLLIARALLAPVPYPASGLQFIHTPGGEGPGPADAVSRVGGVRVFVVCFLPHPVVQGTWTLAVLEIKEGWGRMDWGQRTRQWLNDAHQVTLMLMGLNCRLDPVVYCFATRKFRLYIKDNLKKVGRSKGFSETAITHISMVECKNVSQRHHSEQQQLKV